MVAQGKGRVFILVLFFPPCEVHKGLLTASAEVVKGFRSLLALITIISDKAA